MSRNLSLDILRVLACLMVVGYHYFYYGPLVGRIAPVEISQGLFSYGYLGVDIFFVISGYVIQASLNNHDIRSFFIARFIRLYPMYWICLVSTLCIMYLFADKHVSPLTFLANLTMVHTVMNIDSIDGVYWTLAIELIFYSLVSVSFYLGRDKFKHLLLLWSVVSMLAVFNIINLGFFHSLLILNWIPYFLFGMSIKVILDSDNLGREIAYFIISIISFVTLLYRTYERSSHLSYINGSSLNPEIATFGLAAILIFSCAVIKLNLEYGIFSKFIVYMSLGTYPMYLLHQEIGYVFFNNVFSYFDGFALRFFFLIFLMAVSCIVYPKADSRVKEFIKSKVK